MTAQDFERLSKETTSFLRKYCNLDSEQGIVYSRIISDPGFISAVAMKGPWYRSDPLHYRPVRRYDEVEEDYNAMQSGLPTMVSQKDDYLYNLIGNSLQDSEESVLVDVGSGLGRRFPMPLARKKRSARIFMIDMLTEKDIYENLFKPINAAGKIIPPAFNVEVRYTGNFESWVNDVLAANGYRNVTYISKELAPDISGEEMPQLKKVTQGRHVTFSGMRNTKGLGYATIREGRNHMAEKIFVTPTALEKMRRSERGWSVFERFLSRHLTPREIDKYFALLHDEKAVTGDHSSTKYDYHMPEEKRIGTALKQLFVLSLVNALTASGYITDLYLEEGERADRQGAYNQYDHILISSR